MTNNFKIILIDDDEHIRKACRQALELEGFEVVTFNRAGKALGVVTANFPGIIISDIKMPGLTGLELLGEVVKIDSDLPVVLMTGHGDIAMAVQAMRDGAYDFIEKPFASDYMVDTVKRAIEKRKLVLENRSMTQQLDGRSGLEASLIGSSPTMQSLRRIIENVSSTNADVLILGETGTGKELVARNIHDLSERSKGPFVAINCGAMPENIFESELFGHEAGAFTGAQKQRVGKFEYANGGTIFLDEIEAMPLDLQVKLLRTIQERSVERLGSNKVIPLDIRLIAATKIDLYDASKMGVFREDLYYRLNVVTVEIPPLRHRGDDIAQLFRHFLINASRRFKRDIPDVDRAKLDSIMSREWLGNVRELQNAADRYVLGLAREINPIAVEGASMGASLSERLDVFEKLQIQSELERQVGSIKKTYEALGIGRKTLYDKMQKHGLAKDILKNE